MTFDRSWTNDDTEALFKAVLSLETTDEASVFFRDLCTLKELNDMSQRWAVVRQLDRGLSYREISAVTGVATATITRINQWLRHGTGGYRMALSRITSESEGS
jgi:TrpR-related protein YerC/YecD